MVQDSNARRKQILSLVFHNIKGEIFQSIENRDNMNIHLDHQKSERLGNTSLNLISSLTWRQCLVY
jgi:hypothetical protein